MSAAKIPEWAVEAVADWPVIPAADAGPLIAIFAEARKRLTGCPCGCMSLPGQPDPDCVRFRPIGPPVDWSQQCEAGPAGFPVSAA